MPLRDDYEYTQEQLDQYSDILNPNNDSYWGSRGEENPKS